MQAALDWCSAKGENGETHFPGHVSVAFLNGAILAAMVEGPSAEMLRRFEEAIQSFKDGGYSVDFPRPTFAVVQGGKSEPE